MGIAVWDVKGQMEELKGKEVFDCLLAEYVLSEGKFPLLETATFERYHVSTLEDLAKAQAEKLQKDPKLASLYYNIELPLAKILWQMEQNGIALDQVCLQEVGNEITKQTNACVAEINILLKAQVNLSSPAQVGNILVAQFKVPLPKTPSGQYATGEQVLMQFRSDFPIIDLILTYRELTKLQSTYVVGLLKTVAPDGKVHTTYNQSAVITGRLSSSRPNLQNIPSNSDLGKQIKACFTPSPTMTLLSFDYSQQELRILACMAQDETLLRAFREGKDIHKVTASQIFNTQYESVTKVQRSAAKTINFGIVYGMGKFGLSQQLHITVEEAALFISQFYANFPGIKQFFDSLLVDGQKQNYIETILGRRRYVFNGSARNFIDNNTRRELINFPIQGSAADFVKKAMVRIDQEVLQKRKDIRMLLQIHDELLFEIEDSDEKNVLEVVRRIHSIMSGVYDLGVPMSVDVKMGKKWGTLEKMVY